MSYRDALKVFKLEHGLTDDETAFLNTLRAMSESERELLVESLSPQVNKKPVKPPKKVLCVVCGYAEASIVHRKKELDDYHEFQQPKKSRRRNGISDAIKGTAGAAGKVVDDNQFAICTYTYPQDGPINPGLNCGEYKSNAIHDKQAGYAGYHEFVPVSVKYDNYQEQAGAVVGGD